MVIAVILIIGCIYVAQLNDEVYRSGLDTESLDPSLWCGRVLEYITHEVLAFTQFSLVPCLHTYLLKMREDRVWLRWSRYMKATCTSLFSSEREHLRKNKQRIELVLTYHFCTYSLLTVSSYNV